MWGWDKKEVEPTMAQVMDISHKDFKINILKDLVESWKHGLKGRNQNRKMQTTKVKIKILISLMKNLFDGVICWQY